MKKFQFRLQAALDRRRELSSSDKPDGALIGAVQSTLGHPYLPGSTSLTAESFGRCCFGGTRNGFTIARFERRRLSDFPARLWLLGNIRR